MHKSAECSPAAKPFLPHTSDPIPSNAPHQAVNPIDMLLRFSHHNRVTFLQNFMYRNQGLERLNFVGKHRLTARSQSATKSVIISTT
jgi:hypothetical protein